MMMRNPPSKNDSPLSQQYPFTIHRGEYHHLLTHLLIGHTDHELGEAPLPHFLFEIIHTTLSPHEISGIFDMVNDIFYLEQEGIQRRLYTIIQRSTPRPFELDDEDRYCSTLITRTRNARRENFFLHCSNIPSFNASSSLS